MDINEYIKSQTGIFGQWKSASEISTFKGGGRAYVFYPESIEKAIEIIAVLSEENIPFSMLGGGSNTLVSDGDCKEVLVSAKHLDDVRIDGKNVVCECGAPLAKIMAKAREKGLGGLEFLSGVPCTIGGALKMNAGAFMSQIGYYATKLYTLSRDFANFDKIRVSETNVNSKDFSYRKGANAIVLKAMLTLDEKSSEASKEESRFYLSQRRVKQPSSPSLGSVFSNGEIPSGKLIEACGLKGARAGGAEVSTIHANFIINRQDASASDYLELVALCKRAVYEKFGVTLEEEFVQVK